MLASTFFALLQALCGVKCIRLSCFSKWVLHNCAHVGRAANQSIFIVFAGNKRISQKRKVGNKDNDDDVDGQDDDNPRPKRKYTGKNLQYRFNLHRFSHSFSLFDIFNSPLNVFYNNLLALIAYIVLMCR